MKTVSQLDANGYLVSLTEADQSPLEEGVFLLPAGCVDALPGDIPPGTRAKFNGVEFVLEDIPTPVSEPVVAPTLDEMKAAKWDAIKSERDRRRFEGGAKVGIHWFLSTATATSEYNSLILISSGYPETTVLRAGWRTMDGAAVDMTPALAKSILASGFAHVAFIDDAAQAHKEAMEAAADPATYDFSGGWPAMYEAAL